MPLITWLSSDGEIEFLDSGSITDRVLCIIPPSDADSLVQHTAAEAATPLSRSDDTGACEEWVNMAQAAER
ncbi:hypothetical protein [Myceligenerans salitolerans]|uniref:Uncharacterized protein n=1 Tax=Myceligenerans salitolerans TaxID=1230528 RepID=A0ABS3IA22_9MICO|nr:hypothetical protein [Myceligenerans salitolerans]MBO0609880.1 hypothetical protein [Myceligenerans salitolerans]